MSDPNNPPPPDDDDWGSGGEEWGRPQQPGTPPPQQPGQGGYQPPPPPGGYQPPPGQQPAYGPGPQQPGGPGQAPRPGGPTGPAGQAVPNYLVLSILATLLCCLPTGVVGIVYSSQVNTKLAQGDVAGAKKASDNARLWSIISVGAGVLLWLFLVLVSFSSQDQTYY